MAAQRGVGQRSFSASQKAAAGSASRSLTASERAYSVAAAAGLILETPPLRRIYSMPPGATRSLNGVADLPGSRHAALPSLPPLSTTAE